MDPSKVSPTWAAKYPFTEEAREYVSRVAPDIEEFGEDDLRHVVDYAYERAKKAVSGDLHEWRWDSPEKYAVSYPLSVAIVRTTTNPGVFQAFAKGESQRVSAYLEGESPQTLRYLAQNSLSVPLESRDGDFVLPLREYVRFSGNAADPDWRLVNQRLEDGEVYLGRDELAAFLGHKVREVLVQRLSSAPSETPSFLEEYADRLVDEYKESEEARKSRRYGRAYRWVDELLETPVRDGRNRLIWLVISPYLVNIKNMDLEEARRTALAYLRECDKLKSVGGNLESLTSYYVQYAQRKGLKPLTLKTLRKKYPSLYEVLEESLSSLGG